MKNNAITPVAGLVRSLREYLPLSPVVGLRLNAADAYRFYIALTELERIVYRIEEINAQFYNAAKPFSSSDNRDDIIAALAESLMNAANVTQFPLDVSRRRIDAHIAATQAKIQNILKGDFNDGGE